MDKLTLFTIALSRVKKIGIRSVNYLLERFGSVEELYQKSISRDLEGVHIDHKDLSKIELELNSRKITPICFWDNRYPYLLSQLPDKPIVLYAKGNLDLLNYPNLISVVGTRNITDYGKKLLDDFIPVVSTSNCIVSGLAYGVDAYAHNKAIECGNNTIAVLPSSVDQPIPLSNQYLYNKILSSGNLIISEFPPHTLIQKGMFPRRNRIIAGLSSKTVVIEAGEKSGAIITAKLAFDYNRDVFAFPGNINYPASFGCNKLIKDNIATILTSFADLTSEISGKLKGIDVLKLGDFEKILYYAILPGQKTLTVLSEELGVEIDKVSVNCSSLALKGLIRSDDQGKFYIT